MPRKPPIRTCVACGAVGDKRDLLRVVRTPAGSVEVDASGRQAGRGAYLCRDAACFAVARKKRLFGSKLRCSVSAQDMERLEEEFLAACESARRHGRDGE